jgi:hypothetical protein
MQYFSSCYVLRKNVLYVSLVRSRCPIRLYVVTVIVFGEEHKL